MHRPPQNNPKGRTLADYRAMGIYYSKRSMDQCEKWQWGQCQKYPTAKHPRLREYEAIRAAGYPHWYVRKRIIYRLTPFYGPQDDRWQYIPVGLIGNPIVRGHLTLLQGGQAA